MIPEEAGVVAVVGASSDPSKFGNKAVRAYQRRGWTVYAVNPNQSGTIEGAPVVARLADIDKPVDRVTIYVQPEIGIGLLPEIKAAAPKEFYVNPGAESEDFMAQAEAIGLDPIYACSIIDIGERP